MIEETDADCSMDSCRHCGTCVLAFDREFSRRCLVGIS